MKFKVDGRELETVDNIRVGEACEAEKALGVTLEDGSSARMAIMLFAALRRDQPQKPIGVLADEVMRIELASFEEVEEENPPAEAPAADVNGDGQNLDALPTSGRPLSAPSA